MIIETIVILVKKTRIMKEIYLHMYIYRYIWLYLYILLHRMAADNFASASCPHWLKSWRWLRPLHWAAFNGLLRSISQPARVQFQQISTLPLRKVLKWIQKSSYSKMRKTNLEVRRVPSSLKDSSALFRACSSQISVQEAVTTRRGVQWHSFFEV